MKALDPRLATIGFRRLGRKNWHYGDPYRRELSGVRQDLGIGGSEYLDGGLEIGLGGGGVRFDEVELMVAEFEEPHPLIGLADTDERCTLCFRLGENSRGPGDPLARWGGTDNRVWLIPSEEAIPNAIEEVVSCVIHECAPRFDELSDMRRAFELLSGDDVAARPYSGPDHHRAMQVVALALFLDGFELAHKLGKDKLRRLRGEGKMQFDKWLAKFVASRNNGAIS